MRVGAAFSLLASTPRFVAIMACRWAVPFRRSSTCSDSASPATRVSDVAELHEIRPWVHDEFGRESVVTETRRRSRGRADLRQRVLDLEAARGALACTRCPIARASSRSSRRFFIERLTRSGGSSSTIRSSAVAPPRSRLRCAGACRSGCDVNPLSRVLLAPRLASAVAVAAVDRDGSPKIDFAAATDRRRRSTRTCSCSSHPETLRELVEPPNVHLRRAWRRRSTRSTTGSAWSRSTDLTGHSPRLLLGLHAAPEPGGDTVDAQRKINAQVAIRTPPRR